ncbi:MAG TPA: HEAT repeat domain-containing protein [Actinomycetota bacterium]
MREQTSLDIPERDRAIAALLRQLSIGLSAYRLFPGDLSQPGFIAAVQRIDAAAQRVLANGPLEAEVTGDGFVIEDVRIPPDEAIERLALACYDRRAERIRIRSAPPEADLGALYDVLVRPPEEVLGAGGPDAIMRKSGVVSIVLGELNPHGVETAALQMESLRGKQQRDLSSLRDAMGLSDEAVLALGASPQDLAESLFSRFQAVVSALPPEMGTSLDLYRMLKETVEGLPPEQRIMLNAVLLDRAMEDPLAERYIGTMSDTELARVVVEVAERFDRDPAEMAERLVSRHLRSGDLVDLTVAVAGGAIDSGTVIAGLSQAGLPPPEGDPSAPARGGREPASAQDAGDQGGQDLMIYETVSDLLGRSLLAREQEDMASLRAAFPDGEGQHREAAAHAVRDYLRVEQDLERLERVLASWMGEARGALRQADLGRLQDAVAVLERPRAEAQDTPERALLFTVYRNEVPDEAILGELVDRAREEDGRQAVAELLRPLEDSGVRALLNLLADRVESSDRSIVIALATELAREHLPVVEQRVGDRRVPVVRDAVTVAYRSGGSAALPILERASRHPAPQVREEAVRGLIAVAGAGAVTRLRDLARDTDERVRALAVTGLGGLVGGQAAQALVDVASTAPDAAVRKEAIEHLARNTSAEAGELLKAVAAGRTEHPVPRPLRRHAKTLAKQRASR